MSANPIRIRIDGSGSCEPLAPQAAAEKLTPGQAWTPPTSAEALAALAQAGIPVFVDNGALFVANETDTDGRPLSLAGWCAKHGVGPEGQAEIAARCAAYVNACAPAFAPRVALHRAPGGKPVCDAAGRLLLHVGRIWFNADVLPGPLVPMAASAIWEFSDASVSGVAALGRFADKDTTLRPDGTADPACVWSSEATPWVAPGAVDAQGLPILPGPNAGYYTDWYAAGALAQSDAWGVAATLLDTYVSLLDGQPHPNAVPATDENTRVPPADVNRWLRQNIPGWTDDNPLCPLPDNDTGPWRPGLYRDDEGNVVYAKADTDANAPHNFRDTASAATKTWPGDPAGWQFTRLAARVGTLTPTVPDPPWAGAHAPADPAGNRFLTPQNPQPIPYWLHFHEGANLDAATLVVTLSTGLGNKIARDAYALATVAYYAFGPGDASPAALKPLGGAPEPIDATPMGNGLHRFRIPLAGLFQATDGQTLDDLQTVTLRYGLNTDGSQSGITSCPVALPNVPLRHLSAAWGPDLDTAALDPSLPPFASWQPPALRPW